jgi:hypothetical protein
MKTYGGSGGIAAPFLTSTLDVSGQPHALAALSAGKSSPRTHWIGGCVCPRTGLDAIELHHEHEWSICWLARLYALRLA